MIDIKNTPHFDGEKTILNGFILLDYTTTNETLDLNLIGTDKDRKKLIIYLYQDKLKYKKTEIERADDLPIYNVISCDYFSRKKVDYLIVSKYKNEFRNTLIYEDNGKFKEMKLESTTASPLLMCYKDSRPSLLFQTKSETFILKFELKINKEFHSTKKILENFPKLHPKHTSAYISLDSKYNPCLALDTLENGKRKLQIYVYDKATDTYIKVNEIDLPNKISPLVLADLDGDTIADLAFIAKENKKFFLYVYKNHNMFDSKTVIYKKEINKECILEENGLPGGIYPVDLYSNSQIHLLVKIKEKGAYKYVLLKNGTWEMEENLFDFSFDESVSISFADINEVGRESLILNYKQNDDYALTYRKNNLLTEDSYFVSVLTYDGYAPEKSFCSSVTGMTYRYSFLEDKKKAVGFQRPQTSFITRKPPLLFLGIGTSPFLITFDGIGGPFINNGTPFNIDIEIIPNSRLVISPRNGNYLKLFLCLSTKQNIFYVFLIYFAVFIITVIFIFYLHIKEMKKRKKARKEEAIFFNFDAL